MKTGVQGFHNYLRLLDSGFRRNDDLEPFSTFYDFIIQYLSEEIREFESDYANKTWTDYQNDRKLQKLIDRTVENILTALIEVCGTLLVEEGVGIDSYSDALKKFAQLLRK